jgi:hypothetical protein
MMDWKDIEEISFRVLTRTSPEFLVWATGVMVVLFPEMEECRRKEEGRLGGK